MMIKRHHAPHDFELNLTPIIDCFVTLICFMLLSATYVNLVGLDGKVPVTVISSGAKTPDEPKFKLELQIKNNGMELIATGAGAASGRKNFTAKDFSSLHAELLKIKQERPKEFSIHFSSAIDMPYEELVRYMDATRNLTAKDGTFVFTDERNGKQVKVDTLFPDFIFANLGGS